MENQMLVLSCKGLILAYHWADGAGKAKGKVQPCKPPAIIVSTDGLFVT